MANDPHTIHVVVSSSWPSTASASKTWLSTSTPPSSVEVTPAMGSTSHGVITPVVTVVSSALAQWWPHHAWPSTSVKRWPMIMGGWGMIETRPTWGIVGWVATVHGNLHVHVVHTIQTRTMAKKTLVN